MNPDSIKILAQHWFSIDNIGIGIILLTNIGPILVSHWQYWHWHYLVNTYWANIGIPLALSIGIILLTHIRPILAFQWHSSIGIILLTHILPMLVKNIGPRQAANMELIIGITLAQYWLKINWLLKNSRVRNMSNTYRNTLKCLNDDCFKQNILF